MQRHIDKHIVSLILFLLISSCFKLLGQHGISTTYAPSKILKHTDRLSFDIPARSHEFRLAYTFQTSGKKRWEHYWRKPRIVLNGLFVDFGNKEILGNAIAVLPELHFTLKQWGKFKLNLQFGTGIAYLNKPFNSISNPENNAIGSNLNNVTSLKFGLEYQWNERWTSSLSTGLVHFSNGLSSSPNKGINTYGLSLSVGYTFLNPENSLEKKDLLLNQNDETPPAFKKWIFDVQYHYGFTENTVPDGPKYGVHALSIGGGYRYGEFLTVFVGAEYEYNDAKYTFFKRNFYTEEEALDRARSTIIYAEQELRYGQVFNRLRLGFYLPYPIKNSKSMYTKVVTGIYLPEIKGYARPYVGVVLKTHTAIADYLGLLFGVSI